MQAVPTQAQQTAVFTTDSSPRIHFFQLFTPQLKGQNFIAGTQKVVLSRWSSWSPSYSFTDIGGIIAFDGLCVILKIANCQYIIIRLIFCGPFSFQRATLRWKGSLGVIDWPVNSGWSSRPCAHTPPAMCVYRWTNPWHQSDSVSHFVSVPWHHLILCPLDPLHFEQWQCATRGISFTHGLLRAQTDSGASPSSSSNMENSSRFGGDVPRAGLIHFPLLDTLKRVLDFPEDGAAAGSGVAGGAMLLEGSTLRTAAGAGLDFMAAPQTESPHLVPAFWDSPLSHGINVIVGLVLCFTMLGLGCTVDVSQLGEHIRRPIGVLLALVCQFVIMPLVAFLLALAFSLDDVAAMAVLLCGCCPGGNLSNIMSLLVHGEMNLR